MDILRPDEIQLYQVDGGEHQDSWDCSPGSFPCYSASVSVCAHSSYIIAPKDAYGVQELPQVYTDFKAMMELSVPANSHLGSIFACFQTLFTKLSQVKYMIPDNIQAMIILSCLPQTISVITQLLVQTKDSAGNIIAPTLSQITTIATVNWEQYINISGTTSKGKNSGKSTNKISAVKYERNNLSFQKQQQGDSAKDKEKGHGKHGDKKQREKKEKKHLNFVELKDSKSKSTSSYFVHTTTVSAIMDPQVAAH